MSSRVVAPLLACLSGAVLFSLLAPRPGLESSERVAELEERLGLLEARLVLVRGGSPGPRLQGQGVEGQALPAGQAALAARLEALERNVRLIGSRPASRDVSEARPSTMSLDVLVWSARKFDTSKLGAAPSLPFWRELVEREGVPERLRFEALNRLGSGLRRQKRHREEAVIFRQLATLAGDDTRHGAKALYDLSWTCWYQKDIDEAFRSMSECARARGSEGQLRKPALHHAADWAYKLSHFDQAREFAGELRRLCEGSRSQSDVMFAGSATSMLDRLDRR